jgi:hypothetical protein
MSVFVRRFVGLEAYVEDEVFEMRCASLHSSRLKIIHAEMNVPVLSFSKGTRRERMSCASLRSSQTIRQIQH